MLLRYGLAVLTLFFVVLNMLVKYQENRLIEILWMCHVSSLMLAVGLVMNNRLLVNISALWVLVGTLIWAIYALAGGEAGTISIISHLGCSVTSGIALYHFRVRMNSWIYALLWYLGMQMIAKLTTPRETNINLAHKIYDYWSPYFTVYWQFWFATTFVIALILWSGGQIILKFFPEEILSRNIKPEK